MGSTADRQIADIAARQHGVVTALQAHHAGLSTDQIKHRVATGRWLVIGRGAYGIAGLPISGAQLAAAACALRLSSATSHLTAAALADLPVTYPRSPSIVVAPSASGRHPFATVHRIPLRSHEITRLRGIPATTVTRTIVDCSSLLHVMTLRNVLDTALDRRVTSVSALHSAVELRRAPQHRTGNARLLGLLDPWTGAVAPDSPAEARLFRQLVAWGFPTPELQIPVVDGHGQIVARLDAGWSGRRIGLEYDSSRWHNPATWDADESRHQLITGLGWELFRVDRLDLLPGNPGLRNRLRSTWQRQPSARPPLGLAPPQSA